MPNAHPTPGLRLTPEKREQLLRLTEAERWRAELVAAREVVEAARPIANAEHDVDPVDVYYLREAIRRYDERCGGGDQ